jgi:integrase
MKALKQIVNGIRVYSRHSAECNYAKEAAHVKCDCPKWLQFQVAGKQIRITAGTRSFVQAKLAAQHKEKELAGELTPTASEMITVEQAVQNWLAHRDQQKIDNAKAKLMSGKLLAFCRDCNIAFLAAVTKAHLSDFKLTLDFRSGDSNSLRVHLSVLGGFFRWAVDEAGYITVNPFPKFKLKFERPEIVPPTTEEVNRVLVIPSVHVFASLMRFSGMAISDASTLKRSALVGNLITGRRHKTDEAYRLRIPMWLADELRALPPVDAAYFFWDGVVKLQSLAGQYRRLLDAAFAEAGVEMTPHRFRHYFISSTLATGISVEDVSAMVGTSPTEIRKTYRRWIKEATDRLDQVQEKMWIAQGLDAQGNPQMARP